ncbi:MAG TPA: IPT/TIG domain-containing protein, partial [Candidatus Kapabacteria bacterium]|nr:IPT/TIG domain-containing protein [Candidatus Kapabacteria bacterium]
MLSCVVVLFGYGCKKNNPVATQTSELPVVVESFIPQCSSVGQVIVITGENFNPTANLNYVYFSGRAGGYVQGDVDSAVPLSNPTRLYVTIPPAVASGVVIVKVGDSMDSTKQVLRIMLAVSPVIKDYEPKEGNTGTPLTISGTGFDTVVQNISVRIGTVPATVVSATTTQIHCTVPAGAAGGQITVLMDCDSVVLPGVFKVRPDSIVSFTPSQGPIGSQVTVTTNFLTDTTDKVYFGNIQAQILSTSGTQITTKVPANVVTAPITLSYSYGGATSVTPFTVTKRNPKITSILPISGHAGTVVTITGTNFNP